MRYLRTLGEGTASYITNATARSLISRSFRNLEQNAGKIIGGRVVDGHEMDTTF